MGGWIGGFRARVVEIRRGGVSCMSILCPCFTNCPKICPIYARVKLSVQKLKRKSIDKIDHLF